MEHRVICIQDILNYKLYLEENEKSEATIKKYMHDIYYFYKFIENKVITKLMVLEYKNYLKKQNYALTSINSMLVAMNGFLLYLGYPQMRVKTLKIQRKIFINEKKEMTKEDYKKLLLASKKNTQLNMIIQTIANTGIRISELKYFTIETITRGEIVVNCKNKNRIIFIPKQLQNKLLTYAKKENIQSGEIFITRNGKSLDRSNIWKKMKKMCAEAGITSSKVYPHNLRKLFARVFYNEERDIAKLADLLGHTSIETTRIYILSSGSEHKKKIEKMGLLLKTT